MACWCGVKNPYTRSVDYGTTGLSADRFGRNAILVELNPAYAELARRRITGDAPMFTTVEVA